MPLTLLCSRLNVREVNFQVARFVVGKATGLDVDGRHLEMGEEVPVGVLSADALRQIYDTPLRRIETLEFAFQDDGLRSECVAHGVQLVPAPPVQEEAPLEAAIVPPPDIDRLPYGDLVELCKDNGVNSAGNSAQLRKRLKSLLG